MNKIYFTITGTHCFYDTDIFEKDMKVRLVKEPDNPFDKEAIKVELDGLGTVGYVANSVHTIIGESYSAGRIYDKIGDKVTGTVLYKVNNGVLCYLEIE